jgi:hypothetical protein
VSSMVASKHGFPLVRWVVVVCSYDDRGTRGISSRCHEPGQQQGGGQVPALHSG